MAIEASQELVDPLDPFKATYKQLFMDFEMAERFLCDVNPKRFNPNFIKDNRGNSPLGWAIGHAETDEEFSRWVEMLVLLGARMRKADWYNFADNQKINRVLATELILDKYKFTPPPAFLQHLIYVNQPSFIRLLISFYEKYDCPDSHLSWIEYATMKNRAIIVDSLIEYRIATPAQIKKSLIMAINLEKKDLSNTLFAAYSYNLNSEIYDAVVPAKQTTFEEVAKENNIMFVDIAK